VSLPSFFPSVLCPSPLFQYLFSLRRLYSLVVLPCGLSYGRCATQYGRSPAPSSRSCVKFSWQVRVSSLKTLISPSRLSLYAGRPLADLPSIPFAVPQSLPMYSPSFSQLPHPRLHRSTFYSPTFSSRPPFFLSRGPGTPPLKSFWRGSFSLMIVDA